MTNLEEIRGLSAYDLALRIERIMCCDDCHIDCDYRGKAFRYDCVTRLKAWLEEEVREDDEL